MNDVKTGRTITIVTVAGKVVKGAECLERHDTASLEKKKCKYCNADIYWIMTDRGRYMPADVTPQQVKLDDGSIVDGYAPHWINCTGADKARSDKKVRG